MTPGDERMGPRASSGLTLELIEMCWRMQSLQEATRVLECGIYRRGNVGIEVRAGYCADDLLYSKLCVEIGEAREIGAQLRQTVIGRGGFTELF
jgi:hypothetical protein